ncbi:HAD-superfamily hydrolase, subfamily IA, variant 1 [Candidatus Ruthia magnifica str. Cm (Calyptogena magnifica)]|uniref:HAD-superfamily hydrolase, subfamily IA, variant 1 n=1 Tax=Ruthia magnifica subsp. Calyptogena magnifica TaxID=413404 RepID=A1AWD7_RUTMC|nr:HAD-IA family hydrolase [Candidatus Ruthturnera calyptogenae]ABL02244.1 HAD-superfamily hydrolase, subfamily IA, variant 1 [Candidatus Ruthia magnifica str. Cm (Calyptogena magnifica)]
MSINTILFDLDGTLIDTAPDLAYALNMLLKYNGLSKKPYEKIKPLITLGCKELIKFGFDCDEFHPDFIDRHQKILNIYKNNISQFSKTFSGIDAFIKTIKTRQMFWGVVTNKPENLTHLLLEKLDINPDVVVCGDILAFNKPHPAPLLYACAQLAINPNQCLFVGDDKNDMLAGQNANIKTVAVTYGYSEVKRDWHYDYLINQAEELLALI